MISIFPSEPVGPSRGPSDRPAKAPSDTSDNSDKASFASMVSGDADAQGDASKTAPETANQTATPEQAALTPQTDLAEAKPPQIDLLGAETVAPEADKLGEAELALATAESAKATAAPVALGEDSLATTTLPDTEAQDVAKTVQAETDTNAKLKADPEIKPEAKAEIAPRPAKIDGDTILAETDAPKGEPRLPGDVRPEGEVQDALRVTRNSDMPEQVPTDAPDLKRGTTSDLASLADKPVNALDKAVTTVVSRDAPLFGTETLFTAAPSQSTPGTIVTTGLTPTAPSIPVASPNDVTGIILNALKNGVEPQEQLIVQLDPPELGRVSIDFKFDAQGVQQITVTTENPEALKRLRELHFELSEALKEHGLSEKNMSFQQQAEERPQPNWQMPELTGTFAASAQPDPAPDPALLRTSNAQVATDRLDLTL